VQHPELNVLAALGLAKLDFSFRAIFALQSQLDLQWSNIKMWKRLFEHIQGFMFQSLSRCALSMPLAKD
jgi:hypothetical protein